jgi:hypothetical protein
MYTGRTLRDGRPRARDGVKRVSEQGVIHWLNDRIAVTATMLRAVPVRVKR